MSEVKFRDIFIAQSDKGPIILNMEEHPDAFLSSIAKGIRYIEYAALAAKDEEIAELKAWLQASRNVSQDLHYKCDDRAKEIRMLKSELAEKDAVLESLLPEIYCLYSQAGFGRLDRANDMDVVKIKYDKAYEVLQKYRKSEG